MSYYRVQIKTDVNGLQTACIDTSICLHLIHKNSDYAYAEITEGATIDESWTQITKDEFDQTMSGTVDNLSFAKAQKMQELQSASDAAVATFKSSALGTPLTYLADERSMAYLNAQYVFVNGTHYDNSLSKWYTVENGFVDHTKDQITQVFLDGRAYINEQKTVKLASLLEQVQSATTIDEVQAIIW
jgi:hypothetical protein